MNSNMKPPVYYTADLQIAGNKYRSKWRFHRGVFHCVEADKDIAWIKDKDFFSVLPRLIEERVYLRFGQ